jgi:hypothetical protein
MQQRRTWATPFNEKRSTQKRTLPSSLCLQKSQIVSSGMPVHIARDNAYPPWSIVIQSIIAPSLAVLNQHRVSQETEIPRTKGLLRPYGPRIVGGTQHLHQTLLAPLQILLARTDLAQIAPLWVWWMLKLSTLAGPLLMI